MDYPAFCFPSLSHTASYCQVFPLVSSAGWQALHGLYGNDGHSWIAGLLLLVCARAFLEGRRCVKVDRALDCKHSLPL